MKKVSLKNFIRTLSIAGLAGALVFSSTEPAMVSAASSLSGIVDNISGNGSDPIAPPTMARLTLSAAMNLALLQDDGYEDATMEEESLTEQKASALKSIELRKKDMSTFRWTPLLSFHFPETPSFSEAYEFDYKPIKLQTQIDVAKRKVQDRVVALNNEISNLYVEIYSLQETIAFQRDCLASLEDGIKKNSARVLTGEGNQSDVEKLEKKRDTLNDSIASNERTKLNDLKKLSDKIGMDVTTNYTFEEPFLQGEMSRDDLEDITEFTLNLDATYYEACMAEVAEAASLRKNWELVKAHYKASDYAPLTKYVEGALAGQAISKKAFKADHKAFLNQIDSYWEGKKKILFFKFPRIWFKGGSDGVRYIQDDPNVIYQGTLDYRDVYLDKLSAEKEVRDKVNEQYEQYITTRNAYLALKDTVAEEKEKLDKDALLNATGQVSDSDDAVLTFDEYTQEQEQYEDDQNALQDALKTYTDTLNAFDRLACGGVYPYLTGNSVNLSSAGAGISYSEKSAGATYYFTPIIQSQEFSVSVSIPEDFPITLSQYELWVNTTRIGDRTDIDQSIRHLALDVGDSPTVKLRFYDDNGEFVDDCVIDPSQEKGPLDIVVERTAGGDATQIGTFSAETNDVTSMVEVTLTVDEGQGVSKYKIISPEGKPVSGDEKIDIKKPFMYMNFLTNDIRNLKIEFYDENDSLLFTGFFDDTGDIPKIMKENG